MADRRRQGGAARRPRGKRNEPANVVQVAEMIAGLKGTTCEAVATATSANFVRIFAP